MTRKECYAILGLAEGADLAEVKRAYRRLAFSLHPDLNPDIADAPRRFQRLNEAYVLLTQSGPAYGKAAEAEQATARAREGAQKAYSKAGTGKSDAESAKDSAKDKGKGKEDVLNDILNDPFARRVFEDIYSHIRYESQGKTQNPQPPSAGPRPRAAPRATPRQTQKNVRPKKAALASEEPGVVGKLKGWLRRQIDDVQVLRLPKESLIPGARVRLQIQHGISGEAQTVELTLPPEFVPGKTMRLKGMGKRLGSWRGDLYVRIEPA